MVLDDAIKITLNPVDMMDFKRLVSDLYSATYLTTPVLIPKDAIDVKSVIKLEIFPVKANPSGPIKIAYSLIVTNPTNNFTNAETPEKMSSLIFSAGRSSKKNVFILYFQ